MESSYKIKKIVGGYAAILRATGNVVAEYDDRGKLTKIVDWLHLPQQEYVEAYAASM